MSNKTQLLQLMQNDDHAKAIGAVIHSGLLPEELLKQWLDSLVKRAIHRTLGKSGVPEWEAWATDWLSGADRSAEKAALARAAADVAREAAAWAARVAADVAWAAARAADTAQAAWAAVRAAASAVDTAWAVDAAWAEIEVQYQELLELVNALNTGDES